MTQLTEKQKKIAWAIAALLICIHFAPRFWGVIHPAASHAEVGKPSAAHYIPQAPPPPPPSPEAIAAAKYTGVWVGSALMPDQSRCTIKLEVRVDDPLTKQLKGYESKTCIPSTLSFLGARPSPKTIHEAIVDTAPVSSVMTGRPQDGGLSFTVDQTIGAPPDGCQLSGFNITDFGLSQVMAQWQEGTCPTGKMLLKKARG